MNTLKLSLIVCLIAFSETAISQSVTRNNRSTADSLRDGGDIPGALAEYKKIYFQNPEDQHNVYNYACALSINKQIDSSFKYLYIAVEMDTSVASLIDPDFLTIREDSHWQDFENQLISMLNKKFKNPYSVLARKNRAIF